MPWGWTVANALVFRKVRQALGLDRCRTFMSAAAPIMHDTLHFFASLNIPILEIYGMSETSGKFSSISYKLTLLCTLTSVLLYNLPVHIDYFISQRVTWFVTYSRCLVTATDQVVVTVMELKPVVFSDMSSSVRPSVCLSSVTFGHPTRAIEIFGSVLCHVVPWPSLTFV